MYLTKFADPFADLATDVVGEESKRRQWVYLSFICHRRARTNLPPPPPSIARADKHDNKIILRWQIRPAGLFERPDTVFHPGNCKRQWVDRRSSRGESNWRRVSVSFVWTRYTRERARDRDALTGIEFPVYPRMGEDRKLGGCDFIR